MKYLFLDIDGVLNHEEWYEKIHDHPELYPGSFPFECFDPDCVKRVNEILELTDTQLVISSSWRLDEELCNTFTKVGLSENFLVTPSLSSRIRGEEIDLFLKTHPCDNYAILDDDVDMLDSQKDHFVWTACLKCSPPYKMNRGTGLTERVKEKAINILKDH